MNTYISLFSSAGVGCYGFKEEGFECIATSELIQRRLDIQRYNNKCKFGTGYICGDIADESIKSKLYNEVELWKDKLGIQDVDVIIATPPCQGMSVANHKKSDREIKRNSLIVESIKIIGRIKPKFFIFENVPSFMKTICTDIDGNDKTISEAIMNDLGVDYIFTSKIINFKDYGACSSRKRTLVIGVSKKIACDISPYELFPLPKPEKTLRQVIGSLKSLNELGEIDPNDIYHAFRPYPEYMRSWISCLKEGQTAFDNKDDSKKPHQVKDGVIVVNKQKNADKYRRQLWDKAGPCIHTRNDQLASQNTIHPHDDRVFSIRELMRMMTVPDDFRWSEESVDVLNAMPTEKKKAYLKKNAIKIRQSLGEAVPTVIFREIAYNIAKAINVKSINKKQLNELVESLSKVNRNELLRFIEVNPMSLSVSTLSKVAEMVNSNREANSAYYTDKALITHIMNGLPETVNDAVNILEPSAGVGNFVPLLIRKYANKKVRIDLVDIDDFSLSIAKALLKNINIPENVLIRYITDDFLVHEFHDKYDIVIGNPPFHKIKKKDSRFLLYESSAINKTSLNLCSFFLDKAVSISNYVAMILPKSLLSTPEFKESRNYLSHKHIERILDFGEKGFPGVLIETIAIFIDNTSKPSSTIIESIPNNKKLVQKQSYIFDQRFPYWIIYRDANFDAICKKMDLNCFQVFRDRQITNNMMSSHGDVRVLKSRNINDNGSAIIDIPGYDSYISFETASQLAVYSYLNADDVYLVPNMTYKPRMIKKPAGVLVNGSLAILTPIKNPNVTVKQMRYFSSDEFRSFYRTARNYQTRSLNVDANSVYFYGLLKD